MGKHDDFIKISYCDDMYLQNTQTVYKCFMKSRYEKDLKSVNTRSNLYICILISNEPASSQKVLNGRWKLK